MNMMLGVFLVAVMAVQTTSVLAHDDQHGEMKGSGIKKEQKPWGIAGDAEKIKRTITLKMTDNMRFAPDRIEVVQGETVKLSIKNDGKMMHEMVIGTRQELDEHAALMLKHPGMEHHEPYMAHVPAGKIG